MQVNLVIISLRVYYFQKLPVPVTRRVFSNLHETIQKVWSPCKNMYPVYCMHHYRQLPAHVLATHHQLRNALQSNGQSWLPWNSGQLFDGGHHWRNTFTTHSIHSIHKPGCCNIGIRHPGGEILVMGCNNHCASIKDHLHKYSVFAQVPKNSLTQPK